MRHEAIQAWIDRRPFLPFLVRTTDGSSYFVRHTDYITITAENLTLQLWDDQGRGAEVNSFDVVALEDIGFSDRISAGRKPDGRK